MNLADRRGGDWAWLESGKACPPVAAPLLGKNGLQLRWRHAISTFAKAAHDLAQFRRKQVTCIHRDHLPKLHCSTAKMRKLVGDARNVAWRQQHVAHAR